MSSKLNSFHEKCNFLSLRISRYMMNGSLYEDVRKRSFRYNGKSVGEWFNGPVKVILKSKGKDKLTGFTFLRKQ